MEQKRNVEKRNDDTSGVVYIIELSHCARERSNWVIQYKRLKHNA